MLYVKNIGLSTAVMSNVETMADILIEKNIYSITRNSKKRDAVKDAVEEANAEGITKIYVTMGDDKEISSLAQAFSQVRKETAIICTQEGDDKCLDAAVIVVTPEQTKTAWAAIESCESGKRHNSARISEVYKKKGPVGDALCIIEACIAKYYGFDFQKEWKGEIFLDEKYNEDIPLIYSVSDAEFIVKQVKGIRSISGKKTKYMVPVQFKSVKELEEKLTLLREKCDGTEIQKISKQYLEIFISSSKDNKVIVLLAMTSKDLKCEIEMFYEQKEHWLDADFIWKSKAGSCYYATPIGKDAKICYINPPGGMFSKVQFYRLFRIFPQLRELLSKHRIQEGNKDELIVRYYFEMIAIMLTVKILEIIGVKQDAVIGGSLGELSIPIIFDAVAVNGKEIHVEDCSLDGFYTSIKIIEELMDSQQNLSETYFGKKIGPLEKWYLVCDYEEVSKEIEKLPKGSPIFITIIGSPRDIVISGTGEMCRQLIENLGCYATQFKDPIYAHTPVLELVYDDVKEKVMKINGQYRNNLPFVVYSTYHCKEIGKTVEDYAESFANCIIKQVNMPDVFTKAYDDGCRVFIDLGSSMFCSRWAKNTLQDKEDACVLSLYDKNMAQDSILCILSILIANHIHLDFSHLMDWFYPEQEKMIENEVVLADDQKNSNLEKDSPDNEITQLLNLFGQMQLKNNNIVLSDYVRCEKRLLQAMLKEKTPSESANCKKIQKKECLYNYEQILEMTGGSMSKVLGSTYKEVDKYAIRARMPLPPYLFVSRILSMNFTYGKFEEGSFIEAEYDVPYDSVMKVGKNRMAPVVYSEAGHIGILLAACMGIDEYSHGKAKFRITDVTTKYVADVWPQSGDTIRMKFIIDKVIQNNDITLLLCTYKVYLQDKLFIDVKETGGFFTQEVLDKGAGVVTGSLFSAIQEKHFHTDLYHPVTLKRKFSKEEVHAFLDGNIIKCFGKNVVNNDTQYQVCEDAMFVDEIIDMSETGGKYGLGYIIASKDIEPSFWPFQCHFKNDPVLPGTIMLEGLSQTLTFFETCMGIFNTKNRFETRLTLGYPIQSKFRGEVKCSKHTLVYKAYPKEVKLIDGKLKFVADGEVYCDGLQVIVQKNLGVIVEEYSES